MAESYKLTYFNSKGAAEPIRLLLAYGNIQYEDKRVEFAGEWPEIKKNFPWGQLPVLEVGGVTLAQSNAICRFVAKKVNLMGGSDMENAKIDEYADAAAELRVAWGTAVRQTWENKDQESELMKTFLETTLPRYYGIFEGIIVKNEASPYLVGSKLTWIDVLMAHYVFVMGDTVAPGVLDKYPNLAKLMETVFDIPQIKAWIEKRPKTQY